MRYRVREPPRKGLTVDQPDAYLLAITGRAGILGFLGHEHAVLATEWSVEPEWDGSDWTGTPFTLTIPVASLVIDRADARRIAQLKGGPGAATVRKVQKRMLGPDALDAARHPTIRFVTTDVVQGESPSELRLSGRFSMHGHSREIEVPALRARRGDGTLSLSGTFQLRQTDYGIEPQSAGLGTIDVDDLVRVRFQLLFSPPT